MGPCTTLWTRRVRYLASRKVGIHRLSQSPICRPFPLYAHHRARDDDQEHERFCIIQINSQRRIKENNKNKNSPRPRSYDFNRLFLFALALISAPFLCSFDIFSFFFGPNVYCFLVSLDFCFMVCFRQLLHSCNGSLHGGADTLMERAELRDAPSPPLTAPVETHGA